jgi:predicted dehydrogenase
MSNNLADKKVLLVGAGYMAVEYLKVLNSLNVPCTVVGRSIDSAKDCKEKTGVEVVIGGLESYICGCGEFLSSAIVAVGVEQLANVTKMLLQNGVKKILVEKPGGLDQNEISSVFEETKKQNAEVYIAYNRRFYSSTQKAKEIIDDDGGVTSFNFEFTEWSHQIINMETAPGVKENWLLANSSHVVDLAFFLGGEPKEISCYVAGGLSWHPSASIFAGAGTTKSGVLFSYQANWEAPGRWGAEILTKKHRLVFRPLEKLQIQKIGSVNIEFMEINDKLDIDFKPGLYDQVESFLKGHTVNLCTIGEQCEMTKVYNEMANYTVHDK